MFSVKSKIESNQNTVTKTVEIRVFCLLDLDPKKKLHGERQKREYCRASK